MGYRHPNPRLVKMHRCYSVEEVATLFRIHKNTVRHWLKQGLEPIDNQRPTLIRGPELARFISERRKRLKQKCRPGEMYCLPCRAPKVPAGNFADCIQSSSTAGSLCGICPDCGRLMYRRVNLQKLAEVRGDLDITVTQAHERIA